MWQSLGLTAEPFPQDRVHYLLPNGKHTLNTKKPNSVSEPTTGYQIYAYPLHYTVNRLDLLLSQIPDPNETLGSMTSEVMHHLGQEPRQGDWKKVSTWQDLLRGQPLVKEGKTQRLNNIQPQSVGRFLRLVRKAVQTNQSGIFVNNLSNEQRTIGDEIGQIQGGHTYVVDVALLKPDEQTLVFGDVLRTVYSLYTEDNPLDAPDLPSKVIIFVDELNKYAPAHASGIESPILEQVLDIAERGRSFGIVLFSAQQFLSAVHTRVTGNTSTKVLGRTDSTELNERAYRFLDPDIRMHLTRLNKGELLLSHPIYRKPVKIRFPMPAYRLGTERT